MSDARRIVRIRFGSHLYGTSIPVSNAYFMSVFIPSARDILLQRVKGATGTKRPQASGENNYAGEVFEQTYSLQHYLALLAEGQTAAIEVLFAPEWAMTDTHAPEWQKIVRNRHRLLSRKSPVLIGYLRKQAAKYGGITGSRVAAGRQALQTLADAVDAWGGAAKLWTIEPVLLEVSADSEHMAIVDHNTPTGTVRHWEVCGRKLPFGASIKNTHDVVAGLVDDYGRRSLLAESNERVDWKAVSQAVRVGQQAIELLSTGHITFPLPNSAHILQIKSGELPYQRVAEEMEHLFARVEDAAAKSSLPDEPDFAWIDTFVEQVHKHQVSG